MPHITLPFHLFRSSHAGGSWLRALVLLVAGVLGLGAADAFPLRDAVECHPRAGLPNVAAKLAAGQQVRIAYFGGSITAAAGWRVKILAWFQGRFPKAAISEINAAIGGTGSDLGVYRLGHDVLRAKPDLVFVEFAVNDGGADPLEIRRCMEGIVRQIWAADPATDICYVYTLTGGMVKDLQEKHFPRAASAMEAVADHYGIPSIHLGLEVVSRLVADTLVFKAAKPTTDAERAAIGGRLVFTEDDTHPTDAGHQLYTEVIARHLPELFAIGSAGPHALGAALEEGNYQRATLLPLERAKPGAGWAKLDPVSDAVAKNFANRLPGLYRAETAGTRLSFRFKGTAVSIYDLVGPDCGEVMVAVDGAAAKAVARIDPYCTYHRLASLRIASNLPEAVHSVDIQLDATKLDKAAILFPKNRADLEKNPAKYQGLSWYAGGIMLIGELVE
jgi:lysophospholipase L1-like esterase